MNEPLRIEKRVSARIPTAVGIFQLCLYTSNQDDKEHLALVKGELQRGEGVLARLHSECFTGDVLGSRRCDCGEQLEMAMQEVAKAGQGVIVYLRQEGRGIGLLEKLRAYNLQDEGLDTIDANLALGHASDLRDYAIAAAILVDLGILSVRLMTNNPDKILELEQHGIPVTERIPLVTTVYADNAAYLQTKAVRMHHIMDLQDLTQAIEQSHPNGNRNGNGRRNGHNH
jgi:GTP cyclohydrolase II